MNLLQDYTNQHIPESYLEASDDLLLEKIRVAKENLGQRLLMLAHHYQKDEIVAFADERGDSLQLAQIAARNKEAEFIVFCGVHFMAETADMLTSDEQKVILPDLSAGCSMADMANGKQLAIAWEILQEKYPDEIIPITYINSTAEVKAFVGQEGGAIVTSSNAKQVLEWAFTQKKRVFFLPDQHLGKNTALAMGIPEENMCLWNPFRRVFKTPPRSDTQVILWDGWCSVHQQFTVEQIKGLREKHPEIRIISHPECPHEIVAASDDYGSTSKILTTVRNSPKGSKWAIGTDHNLVGRMMQVLSDHQIMYINPVACACLTMNRIRLPHLAWCLERLVVGEVVNQIKVTEEVKTLALKALNQMMELSD